MVLKSWKKISIIPASLMSTMTGSSRMKSLSFFLSSEDSTKVTNVDMFIFLHWKDWSGHDLLTVCAWAIPRFFLLLTSYFLSNISCFPPLVNGLFSLLHQKELTIPIFIMSGQLHIQMELIIFWLGWYCFCQECVFNTAIASMPVRIKTILVSTFLNLFETY